MAGMDWYHMWNGAPSDPKWIVIAARAKTVPGVAWSVWTWLLDHANQATPRGCIAGVDLEVCAGTFGWELETVEACVAAMRAKGMINDQDLLGSWERRNPKKFDETAAERKRRQRERDAESVTQDVTPCHAPVTASQAVTPLDGEGEGDVEGEVTGMLPGNTESNQPQKLPSRETAPRDTAAAVGEFCTELDVPWPLKEPIASWAGRQDRDPRFAPLDLPREIRKCLEWNQAKRRRPKAVSVALLNWFETALERGARNGNGNRPARVVESAVADLRALLSAGGDMLKVGSARPHVFEQLERTKPALWARWGSVFRQLDFAAVFAANSDYDRNAVLRSEIERADVA